MRLVTATWMEVERKIAGGNAVAILPVGAQEQHGPHLALATDTIMATGLAERLAEEFDALLLPALPYGETWTTAGWKGTISISFNTLVALVTDIGVALAAQQVSALIIVNGHFGNHAPLEQAARVLVTKYGLPTMTLHYPGIEQAAAAVCESTPAAPGFFHADEVETSIMLALKPHAVQMEHAQPEYPQFPAAFGTTPIRLDTFCHSGVFGDPRPATAAKGDQLLTLLTQSAVTAIKAFLSDTLGNSAALR